MATDLSDFYDFLDDDGITTPPVPSTKHPKGKTYIIPSPDAITGARLAALAELTAKMNKGIEVSEADVARLHLDDAEEREFAAQVLGSCLTEMQDDGVSWVRIQRLTKFAFVYFAVGPEAAAKAAEAGAFSGKAPAPTRAQRRHPATTPVAPKAPRASTGSSRRKAAPVAD